MMTVSWHFHFDPITGAYGTSFSSSMYIAVRRYARVGQTSNDQRQILVTSGHYGSTACYNEGADDREMQGGIDGKILSGSFSLILLQIMCYASCRFMSFNSPHCIPHCIPLCSGRSSECWALVANNSLEHIGLDTLDVAICAWLHDVRIAILHKLDTAVETLTIKFTVTTCGCVVNRLHGADLLRRHAGALRSLLVSLHCLRDGLLQVRKLVGCALIVDSRCGEDFLRVLEFNLRW